MSARTTSRHARLGVLLSVSILLVLAAPARADVGLIADDALTAAPSGNGNGGGKPGDAQTRSSSTAEGSVFTCSKPLVPIASGPSDYFIGTCKSGDDLMRQKKTFYQTNLHDWWDGGWITGAFNSCGWIGNNDATLLQSTPAYTFSYCPQSSIGYNLTEFASHTNNGSKAAGLNCAFKDPDGTGPDPGHCTDGTDVNVYGICYAYGNVRPMLSGQVATDYIRYYAQPAAGQPPKYLKWRYIAKHVVSGTYWVAVRDVAITAGYGNWMFVPLGCLGNGSGYLPGIAAAS